ncbi:MAG: MarR family transcriptional regulator [Candidatus Dormibacteraeota bacterium]|uniref:MarR family transcriptional regulator n=1 Tax=Candidatus Amunia macphersoniae TaxID=3127014 RepID=A0A934KQR9_9BACT|nr:MarR family transcriptional regulator [Candidatus Dormibacteraeota bacterium]
MTVQADPPRTSVVATVEIVSSWIDRRKRAMAKNLHACGQSPAQLHVLGLLSEVGPTTVSHIATQIGITPPSASAMVDRMDEAGLVIRERNEEDRRVVTVSLAAAGREALERSLGGRHDSLTRILSQLDDEELRSTIRVIERLDEAIAATSREALTRASP